MKHWQVQVRRALAAVMTLLLVSTMLPGANAGFVTGAGSDRTAHLADSSNGLNVTVVLNETFDGKVSNTFVFLLDGSAPTAPRLYFVAFVVSPNDDELRASWNSSGDGPAGDATVPLEVTLAADELPYTMDDVRFAVELRDASGALLDSADFSLDLVYYAPPADGGLFQLTVGTVAAWGLVLLYAGYLHLAHQRLRARAESLERALGSSSREGEK